MFFCWPWWKTHLFYFKFWKLTNSIIFALKMFAESRWTNMHSQCSVEAGGGLTWWYCYPASRAAPVFFSPHTCLMRSAAGLDESLMKPQIMYAHTNTGTKNKSKRTTKQRDTRDRKHTYPITPILTACCRVICCEKRSCDPMVSILMWECTETHFMLSCDVSTLQTKTHSLSLSPCFSLLTFKITTFPGLPNLLS